MRPFRILLSAFLVLQLSVGTVAQQATATPQRDPAALAILQNSITGLGGATAVSKLSSSIITGSISAAPGANTPVGNFIWEDQLSGSHEFKDSFSSATLNQVFVSGHGSPGFVSNGVARDCYPQAAAYRFAAHLPAFSLGIALQNPNFNVVQVGPTTVNGASVTQVHFELDADPISQTFSPQEWYFDSATGLPLRIEYRLPATDSSRRFANGAVELSDFRAVQGVLVPYKLVVYDDGKPSIIITVSSATFNQQIPSTDFDLPTTVAQ